MDLLFQLITQPTHTTMSDFWNSCLLQLEQELPEQQFSTWILPLKLVPIAGADDTFRLLVPNSFHQKWVKDRYLGRIETLCNDFFKRPVQISVAIGDRSPQPATNLTEKSVREGFRPEAKDLQEAQLKSSTRPDRATGALGVKNAVADKNRLLYDFTFDNLVVGRANDLARAAAIKVSQQPGAAYNPLFVYGGAGLGKTHLIHAIGNSIKAEFPEKTIRYVHAEEYYSDVVRAYQQKSFDAFKRSYRSLDVLLVDDVQFFNGKTRSQEEFFFLFNALIEA